MAFNLFKKLKDPICKMDVDKNSEFKSKHNGKEYYFCSLDCKQEFDKNPGKYA